MATVLECTTEEQRSVVRFLCAKGLNAKDIHKEMFPVYVMKCLSRKALYSCVEKLSQGRSEVSDDETEVRNAVSETFYVDNVQKQDNCICQQSAC
jgi:hypothetical protein